MSTAMQHRKLIDLKRDYESRELILEPEYQRNFIWDTEKQSRLIETIVLGYPINPLHFAESDTAPTEVIDGQQRLTTVFRFIDNKTVLRGLRVLIQLNGMKYKDLKPEIQKTIANYLMNIHTYPSGDPRLKFEIFERLNSGAVALTAQELRNAIYHGSYNDLIKGLAAAPTTKNLLRMDSKRMKDRELILEFFALQEYNLLEKPLGNMKEILNAEMACNKNRKDYEIVKLHKQWIDFAETCCLLFDHPFRRIVNKHYLFNEGLYQACCGVFPKYSQEALRKNSDNIGGRIEEYVHSEEYSRIISSNMFSGARTHVIANIIDTIVKQYLDS